MQSCFMLTSTVLQNMLFSTVDVIIKQLWAVYGTNDRLITLREQNRSDKSLNVAIDANLVDFPKQMATTKHLSFISDPVEAQILTRLN